MAPAFRAVVWRWCPPRLSVRLTRKGVNRLDELAWRRASVRRESCHSVRIKHARQCVGTCGCTGRSGDGHGIGGVLGRCVVRAVREPAGEVGELMPAAASPPMSSVGAVCMVSRRGCRPGMVLPHAQVSVDMMLTNVSAACRGQPTTRHTKLVVLPATSARGAIERGRATSVMVAAAFAHRLRHTRPC